MAQINSLNLAEINAGKTHFAELIKILFFKKNEDLISLLDLDNDSIFLDPLIYAYFNDTNAESKVTLEQLVYGYIDKDSQPKNIKILFDQNGITYLPNIGYFKSLIETNLNEYYFLKKKTDNNYNILSKEGQNIDFEFIKPLYIIPKIELFQYQHPLLKHYFIVNRPSYPNQGEPCLVEVNSITNFHFNTIKNAFKFIEKNFPEIFETIVAANRRIMILDNQAVLCFTSQNILGTAFISSIYSNSSVFFIEEILHQCSHNIFNTMFYDKGLYFKVDFETEMLSDYLNESNETRTLFDVFHGLITVSQRLICFEYIVKNDLLDGDELHELNGRYCNQFERFNLGLEKVNPDIIFTPKGKLIFNEMRTVGQNAINYFHESSAKYNMTNQPSEFSYENFKMLNPYLTN